MKKISISKYVEIILLFVLFFIVFYFLNTFTSTDEKIMLLIRDINYFLFAIPYNLSFGENIKYTVPAIYLFNSIALNVLFFLLKWMLNKIKVNKTTEYISWISVVSTLICLINYLINILI